MPDLYPSTPKPPRPVRRRFLNGRMPLSFTDWGNEGAPLAILVHGSRDHSRSWDAIAPVLQKDHHVIAPDLRGHGDSAWSQDGHYNFAAYLSDLSALWETLKGDSGRQAIVIGHSLGAHIVLRFAGVYPDAVSHIVAIEAVGAPPQIEALRNGVPVEQRIRNWFEERHAASGATPRRFSSVQEAADRMLARHPYLRPAQALHLTRHGLRRAGRTAWQWKHDPYLAVWPFPDITFEETEALWQRITCPTLLLYGERSWPSDLPGQLVGALPHAREIRLAQSGHWPHHDATAICLATIGSFLQASPGA